jgi:WD40 repeat protein/tRNA A-37 threonylcarbamoyl transferase component Bud32
MSEVTPNDLRSDKPEEQQTLLQLPSEKAAEVLATGIQAMTHAPRMDVGPVPLTRVAHYELLKEVGRGGMGVVFKARHVRLNRIVALKMIRGGTLANAEELLRFEKEASAAAQLQHPNIVQLFEVSPHNEQPYLSMEFIGGTSLSERVTAGPLSGRRAALYLELTARAVHYAHGKGIVHRDLKPANVLLDENDQPKVTDFGLAKQLKSRSDQTRTGAILGTPSYMSPEQASGSKDIGPSSDVYSLGAILYEMITGKPPFCGETPLVTLNLVTEQEPLAPSVLNGAVDRDLETICLKCLEKRPQRRYESAESLADDLRRYLDGDPITARRVSIVGRGFKWVRRHPGWTVFSFLSVLSVAAMVAASWMVTYQQRELREQAEQAKSIAALRLETMRHLFYQSEMRQAQQTLRRADLDGVERILSDHWQPKVGQKDLRDWEWHFLKEQCQARLAFGLHAGQAVAVAYRPDGNVIASAGGEVGKPGEIKLWDTRTGKLLQTLKGHNDVITSLAFHPDKPILATSSYDKTVKLWNLETNKEIVTLRGHEKTVNHVAFSPKGDRVASASHDMFVRVWDFDKYLTDPANSVRVFPSNDAGHSGAVMAVAFHPGGKWLASGGKDRAIKLWDLTTGQVEKTLAGHQGEVNTLVFSADGKVLVSGGGQGNQRGEALFWNTETGKLKVSHYGLSDRVASVSMSQDGKVAAAGSDGIVRIWNHVASSEALSFRADLYALRGVAFAPDGLSLVSAGVTGRVSLWNSSGGLETLTLAAAQSTETLAFHPRSPYLASAGARGEIHVWHLDHPDQPTLLPRQPSGIFALAFSPDGHSLAFGGDDRVVRIVDFLNPNRPPILIKGHTARVHAIVFRPDGKMIATAGEDEKIRLHDPTDGKLIQVLEGHSNGILCLAFSPDGNWLASGSYDKTVRLWDLKDNGKANAVLPGHTLVVNSVTFSPDGGTLASASKDRTIRVWNVEKREQSYSLQGTPSGIQSIAFHPHGRRIVSVGDDRMIRLWDIVTRQEILEFEETGGALRQVAFSADGRSLAVAGTGVIRVWQASRSILGAPKP